MAPRPDPDELQQERARILDELMRSRRGRLWAQARKFSVTDQDADDAIEDACVAFLRFYSPPADTATGWMMTTVKHAALAIRRRTYRRRAHDAEVQAGSLDPDRWESELRDPRGSTEEQVETREWATARVGLLAELKPDERTALSLLALGYSHREIEERQGWSPRKVDRCVVEGRGRLRELLAKRGEDS